MVSETSQSFTRLYSPDLDLCDHFPFNLLKAGLSDNVFRDRLELQQTTLQWARQLDENALQRKVQNLIDLCQAVIDAREAYVTD